MDRTSSLWSIVGKSTVDSKPQNDTEFDKLLVESFPLDEPTTTAEKETETSETKIEKETETKIEKSTETDPKKEILFEYELPFKLKVGFITKNQNNDPIVKDDYHVMVLNKLTKYIGMTLLIGYYVNNSEFLNANMYDKVKGLVLPFAIGSVFGKQITYVSILYYIGKNVLV